MATSQRVLWIQSSQWLWLEIAQGHCQSHRLDIQHPDWKTWLLQRVQRTPQTPLFLVSDVVDERYEVQSLPPSPARLKAAVLARKLAAWPWAAGPHTAVKLEALQSLASAPVYLFVALDMPPVNELLAVLAAAGCTPTGIYTASLSLPCWLPMLVPMAAQCVYVQASAHNIRICFLRHQQLLASESLSMPVSAIASSQAIVKQLQHLWLSWQQQQWLDEALPTQVLWLGTMPDDDTMQTVRMRFASITDWRWLHETDLPACLQPPSGAELTASQWAALMPVLNGWPLPSLHVETLSPPTGLQAMRRPLQGWALVTAMLLLLTAMHLWREIEQVSAQTVALKQEVTSLPVPLPYSPERLMQYRGYRLASETIAAQLQLPTSTLALVQQVAAEQPYWRLTSLDWQQNSHGETLDMTWYTPHLHPSAQAAWQHMIAQIQSLKHLDQLEKAPSQPFAASPSAQRVLQGDTDWGASVSREQRLRIHLAKQPATRDVAEKQSRLKP